MSDQITDTPCNPVSILTKLGSLRVGGKAEEEASRQGRPEGREPEGKILVCRYAARFSCAMAQ